MSFQVESTETTLRVNGILLFDALNDKMPGAGVIEDVTQSFVRKVYLPQQRERILRAGTGEERAELDVFFTGVASIKGALIAKYAIKQAALDYEQAVRDVAALTLQINGRGGVAEVLEEIDPQTGEIIQPYVPAVSAVEPLAATVEQNELVVSNPDYLAAVEALAAAEAVIAAAAQEVLDLVALRAV